MAQRAERRRLGFAARVTILLGVVAGLGVVVMGVYVSRALEARSVARLQGTLVTQAGLLQDAFASPGDGPAGARAIQARAQRYARILGGRVTVIGPDGTVLAESDRESVREIENHAERPEVRRALAGGVGSDVRRSATVGRDLLYVAVPLKREGRPRAVLRLALPTREVDEARGAGSRHRRRRGAPGVRGRGGGGTLVSRRVTRPLRGMSTRPGAWPRETRADGAGLGQRQDRRARGRAEPNGGGAAREDRAPGRRAGQGAHDPRRDDRGRGRMDDRGRDLLLNPAARAMFGVEDGGSEGGSFLEVIRQKGLLDLVEQVRTSARPRGPTRAGPSGEPRRRGARGDARLGPGAAGVLLVLHDVTSSAGSSGPERVRGQRLARAQDAAHLHQGIPRDAARRRARRTGARAPIPGGRRDARRAARPNDRRSLGAVQHRERSRDHGTDAAGARRRRRGRRRHVRAAGRPAGAGVERAVPADSPSARTGTGSSRSS